MERNKNRDRLLRILEISPQIRDVLVSEGDLESKRIRIQKVLDEMLSISYNKDVSMPTLEWVQVRDAITVMQNMITVRNETLSGFGLLQYLDDMIHRPKGKDLPPPATGFFEEIKHLTRGIMGKSGIYTEKKPAFQNYEGQRAAKLRSADLSRMMRSANKFMNSYACGLDDHTIRQRKRNKARILKYFKAKESDWGKWNWHLKRIIRNEDTLASLVELSEEEYQGVKLARKHHVPFGITPYYLSLMDYKWEKGRDAAVRAQVIPSPAYVNKMKEMRSQARESMDFMMERDTSPIAGITRRYPAIVILKPVVTCPQICVYCQRNWEIKDVYASDIAIGKEKLAKAIKWIAETPEINEVLVTGGDPFILSNTRLIHIMERLSRISHIERIRIGTRTPVTLPQRITDDLVKSISRFHIPGKREVLIVTHFEHPYEITPESMASVQKFRKQGLDVYNQLVYTFYNSRKFEASCLRHKLRLIGVTPYYTFNTKGKEETDDYRVPIARLLQEQKEESRLMPGTVRTDEIVFNVPRLGKNYLRAWQHHDLISILPDGRRVYEFHPWEKKLELVDTYIHTDVSIYNYLKRLSEVGENRKDYKTIWYYY